jgi:hypothetical protein
MATGFNGLDDAAPNDNAYIGDGAAEIRSVKNALITTFPAVDGEITKPTNYGGAGTQPTAADYSQLFTDMDSLVSPSLNNSPVVPQGLVAMWNGNTGDTGAITALNDKGWFLCTGGIAPNGYTIPNLQDRFVKGWGTDPVGTTSGGASLGTLRTSVPYVKDTATTKTLTKSVTITEANLPEHSHLTVADVNADDENALTSGNAIRKEYSPGGVDAGYLLRGESQTPNIGKTDSYGNASPTALAIDHDAAAFEHDHTVEISGDLEPSHYVIAYIIYAGVV